MPLNHIKRLIAVSKGQDIDKIKHLYDIGHRDFGENFLQELKEKRYAAKGHYLAFFR